MKGDLHVHTTLSDGSLGMEEVIAQAKRIGLDFISITDHDTMSSVSRAKVLGERYGVQTIPGVELTAWDKTRNRKVHILCYAPQKPDRLEGICRRCSEIPNTRHSAMTIQGIARIRNVCMVYSATSFRNSVSRSKLPSTKPGISLMALQILMLMPVIMELISSSV